jgi:hypothetical protein
MSPRESWSQGIERIVSDSQIEIVRPGDIERSVSDSLFGVSEIEKVRRAPQLLSFTNVFRKEEIESEAVPSQLSGEYARQIESEAMPSQLSRDVSEGEQFENQSQLLRESVAIKSFSESESLSKSQQGGSQPDCHERAYRLGQSDFPMEAKGASLGKTMPLRTLSMFSTTDVTVFIE